jgi:hypothetical protein
VLVQRVPGQWNGMDLVSDCLSADQDLIADLVQDVSLDSHSLLCVAPGMEYSPDECS